MFFHNLRADIAAAMRHDPAARSKLEVFLTYPGIRALIWHRRAAFFYHRLHFKLLARWMAEWARRRTGIEIHPAAKIAAGVFIDHGAGVVIGETAEVECGVVIYQGVTLGGTGKEKGKRHPTIGKDAVLSCGAKILGGFTVGEGARIGAGAVVLREVPPYATVVGVPGQIVRIRGKRVSPQEDITSLTARIEALEAEIGTIKNRKNTGSMPEVDHEDL